MLQLGVRRQRRPSRQQRSASHGTRRSDRGDSFLSSSYQSEPVRDAPSADSASPSAMLRAELAKQASRAHAQYSSAYIRAQSISSDPSPTLREQPSSDQRSMPGADTPNEKPHAWMGFSVRTGAC